MRSRTLSVASALALMLAPASTLALAPASTLALAPASTLALAQRSAHYSISDTVVNAGGSPLDGVVPASPGARLTLASIGESAADLALASASWKLDGAFVAGYSPPGEVPGVRFETKRKLSWMGERSAVRYNLYRASLVELRQGRTGSCVAAAIPGTSTESQPGPPGDVSFYLVTAASRLGEEGTIGSRSSGEERSGPQPCR